MKHNARCPQSPTGAHWRVMSWPEEGEHAGGYIGTCRYCGAVRVEDANLGIKSVNVLPDGTTFFRGKSSEFRLKRSKGVQE